MSGTSYSYARENLAALWDEVEDSREAVILTRRGHEDLALLPAHELRSLKETAHLLRSLSLLTAGTWNPLHDTPADHSNPDQ